MKAVDEAAVCVFPVFVVFSFFGGTRGVRVW